MSMVGQEPLLCWTVHPARERPWVACGATMAVLAFGWMVWAVQGDWLWGAGAVLVLVSVLSAFFLPSRFTISAAGVLAEFPLRARRLAWSEVGGRVIGPRGALLSPLPGAAGKRREIVVTFSRDAVAAATQREALERCIPAAPGSLESARDQPHAA